MSAPSDEVLMADVANGGADAFAQLYDRFSLRAMNLARSVCRDRELAEEAVTTAFLEIWRRGSTYQAGRGTVASWLLAAVVTAAVDVARRHADGGPEPLLARLPEAQREAITLALFGQLTRLEIAEQLGLPPGEVERHIRLGLTGLGPAEAPGTRRA